jgi:hypothetical protein
MFCGQASQNVQPSRIRPLWYLEFKMMVTEKIKLVLKCVYNSVYYIIIITVYYLISVAPSGAQGIPETPFHYSFLIL